MKQPSRWARPTCASGRRCSASAPDADRGGCPPHRARPAKRSEAPHFDRTAFRARIIFATIGGGTVNLKLVPEQAEMLIEAEPETFRPLGGWTRQGYVGVNLARIDEDRLEMLMRDAWRRAAPKGVELPD